MKYIVLICDGMADRVNGPTPLEVANTPNFDKLAAQGKTGLMYTVREDYAPGSDAAHLSLLGYDIDKYYPGRGPMEALGAGIDLKHGEIAFRANIATIDENFKVIDRRAGRIREGFDEITKAVNSIDLGIEFEFHHTVDHRGVLVLKSGSEKVTNSDPHETGKNVFEVEPTDKNEEAKKTAEILNEFTKKSHEVLKDLKINAGRELPANVIILRGAGKYHKVPSFQETHGLKGACIATMTVVRGTALYVGMDLLEVEGATGTENTNIENKFKAALAALENYAFVLMNIKATDNFGHDGDFEGKRKMIEKIDSKLPALTDHLNELTIIVTADHATPVSVMDHSADPVMLALVGPNVEPDKVKEFSEKSCAQGELGTIKGIDVIPLLKKYG